MNLQENLICANSLPDPIPKNASVVTPRWLSRAENLIIKARPHQSSSSHRMSWFTYTQLSSRIPEPMLEVALSVSLVAIVYISWKFIINLNHFRGILLFLAGVNCIDIGICTIAIYGFIPQQISRSIDVLLMFIFFFTIDTQIIALGHKLRHSNKAYVTWLMKLAVFLLFAYAVGCIIRIEQELDPNSEAIQRQIVQAYMNSMAGLSSVVSYLYGLYLILECVIENW